MNAMGEAARTAAGKWIVAAVIAGSALAFGGCSASGEAPAVGEAPTQAESAAPSLVGDWKQSNSEDPESWQAATVTADTITINWVSDGGETKALYWAGSAEAPTEPGGSFSWESANDTSQTKNSLLASDAPTKTFTYSSGVISYEVSAMGVTKTVKLEKLP